MEAISIPKAHSAICARAHKINEFTGHSQDATLTEIDGAAALLADASPTMEIRAQVRHRNIKPHEACFCTEACDAARICSHREAKLQERPIAPYATAGLSMENHMLDYSITPPDGILELTPHAPLTKDDFERLGAAVDSYFAGQTKLRRVLIHAQGFPGWEDFGAMAAHMRFIEQHRNSIERVAIATDSHFAGIAAALGKYFSSAELRHFPFAEDARALAWLESPAHAPSSVEAA
jgi:hypothetical protein